MRSDKRSDKFLQKKTPDLRFFSWLNKKRSDIPTHFAKLPLRARERLTESNATFMNVSRFCGQFSRQKKTAVAVKEVERFVQLFGCDLPCSGVFSGGSGGQAPRMT